MTYLVYVFKNYSQDKYITLFEDLLLDNNFHTRASLLNISRNILQTQKVQNISLKKRSQSILLGEVSD